MRITGFQTVDTGGSARLEAEVVWETARRPDQRIFFDVEGGRAQDLVSPGDVFLAACLAPALRNGERRIRVEGIVCPRLRDGAIAASRLLRAWYGPPRESVAIEARFEAAPWRSEGTISFLSGGIDSTFTLRSNHQTFPEGHPGRIRECVLVSGLFAREAATPALAAEFDGRVRLSAGAIAAAAGVPLTIVRTNVRDLEPGLPFFAFEWHGAVLAAVAHLFGGRAGTARIAAAIAGRGDVPAGTHPLLDSLWGSSRMRILHDGFGYSRIEKARAIAPWTPAIESLMVCQRGPLPGGVLNCGRCEKCLRSTLAFVAAGAPVERLSAASRDISPAAVILGRVDPENFFYWRDLRAALRRNGNRKLALAIALKILFSRFSPRRRIPSVSRYARSSRSTDRAAP